MQSGPLHIFAGNPSLSDQGGQLVSSLMSALGGGFDVAMLAEMVKRWQQALQVGRRKEILQQVQIQSIVRPVHPPSPDSPLSLRPVHPPLQSPNWPDEADKEPWFVLMHQTYCGQI